MKQIFLVEEGGLIYAAFATRKEARKYIRREWAEEEFCPDVTPCKYFETSDEAPKAEDI